MAERLGALIAARQRLLRDISHELRSPLARMEMAIGLARQEPATALGQLDRVQRESERLDQLIGHILEYARLERDPATFTFEDLDVADLVRQVVHDAEFESQSPPGRLRVTSADTVRYHGDAQVLHSAIDNVVRNALLHGDPHEPIEVSVVDEGATVQISVRDHGAGVREEDLPHIFEPFYRAAAKNSKHVSTEGTGIGLAITERGAALHGGAVWAEECRGRGAGGYYFCFPSERFRKKPSIAGRLKRVLSGRFLLAPRRLRASSATSIRPATPKREIICSPSRRHFNCHRPITPDFAECWITSTPISTMTCQSKAWRI